MTVRSPITKDKCIKVNTLTDLPDDAIQDRYDSNEYFRTFTSKGKKYYYKHKDNQIKSKWI